ncbi:MAG: hypothetical protein HYX79_06475 [Chloroflexi bacterium]|nr:hypothetical protein [Chloroflexota bacterium]
MQRVNEYLEIVEEAGEKAFRCKCGYILGPATDNYKTYALKCESPLKKAGPNVNPYKVGGEKFVFREFCCPGCYTLLGTDIALRGEPLLRDVEL